MKINRLIQTGLQAVLLMGWGCLLTNCADEADLMNGRQHRQNGEYLYVASLTRTDDEVVSDPMKGKDVQLFLVIDRTVNQSGPIRYNGLGDSGSDVVWDGTPLVVKPGVDYMVFGFMPAMGSSSSLLVNEDKTVGTMTINGLPTVTDQDICIVTGVKAGLPTEDNPLTPGNYAYHAPENTELGYGISLLANHLYSAVQLKFLVGVEYSKLRRIVLKQVTLINSQKNVKVTIPFNVGNSLEPVGTISVAPDGEGTTSLPLYTPDGGRELKTDESIDMSFYFSPDMIAGLSIESVYDVYDTTGTPGIPNGPEPIRKNCKAVNNLTTLLGSLARGAKKNVTMTVMPTYLYMLSEPDADTPMVVAGD